MTWLGDLRRLNQHIRDRVTKPFAGMEDYTGHDPLQQSRRQVRLHASSLLRRGRTPREVEEHLDKNIFTE